MLKYFVVFVTLLGLYALAVHAGGSGGAGKGGGAPKGGGGAPKGGGGGGNRPNGGGPKQVPVKGPGVNPKGGAQKPPAWPNKQPKPPGPAKPKPSGPAKPKPSGPAKPKPTGSAKAKPTAGTKQKATASKASKGTASKGSASKGSASKGSASKGTATSKPAAQSKEAAKKEVVDLARDTFGKVGGAAVGGNIAVETGHTYDFQQKQQGGGPGRGLFQMEGPMQKAYNSYLAANKLTDSASSQMKFVKSEIETGSHIGAGSAKQIRDAFAGNDVAKATTTFMKIFERPGVPHLAERLKAAQNIYNGQ